jgi:hypothetical protein
MNARPTYSIIMLLEDSENGFVTYLMGLHRHFEGLGLDHELILAVNGPVQFAQRCLTTWSEQGPVLKIVDLTRHVPSGICLQTVLPECRGEILIVCGPYRQVADSSVQLLVEKVVGREADLALPWRRARVDPMVNQWQSQLFNWLVRRMTGSEYHDLSSTLRVVRRKVLEETPLYGDLYRYLPILAKRRGFKVSEYAALHAEERGKVGYYGIREYVSRLVDLLSMRFNIRFVRKPLRYFGSRGLLLFLAGMLCLSGAVFLRFTGQDDLGNSPMLMIGLVLMLAGSGIWGVGLVGEIMTFTHGRKRKEYIVERILE